MKNFAFFVILLTFFACGNESAQNAQTVETPLAPPQTTTISGQVLNPRAQQLAIQVGANQYTSVIENGNFRFEFPMRAHDIVSLRQGRSQAFIYVKPGANIQVSFDAQKFPQHMSFSGDQSAENGYLTKKYDLDRIDQGYKTKDYQLEEVAYIEATKKRMDSKMAALEQHIQAKPLDQAFVDVVRADIKYEWAQDRLIYPRYHAFYARKENFETSEQYYDFLNGLEVDNGNLLASPLFRNFIGSYVDYKIVEENNGSETDFNDARSSQLKLDFIKNNFKSTLIRDNLGLNTLLSHMRFQGANYTPELIAAFKQMCQNTDYHQAVDNNFQPWARLVAGNDAPGFQYPDLSGAAHQLADYRGKYVYIDVWATWCGPCKKEIPHLEQLQEDYHQDARIAFISVSVDKNEDAWRKMVTDQNMQGIQLHAPNSGRELLQNYNISGIPRFLLIDPEGKIISAHAPRPSSPNLKTQIEELLQS